MKRTSRYLMIFFTVSFSRFAPLSSISAPNKKYSAPPPSPQTFPKCPSPSGVSSQKPPPPPSFLKTGPPRPPPGTPPPLPPAPEQKTNRKYPKRPPSRGKPTPKNPPKIKSSSGQVFLNNFRRVPDSCHRDEGEGSRELFEKVRINAVLFGCFGI